MIAATFVPEYTASIFLPALYVGLITGFIALFGISIQKNDLDVLILTDIIGLSMLVIVSAVGTDLAEALILPGLVVELAEIMAISELLLTREMRKLEKDGPLLPNTFKLDMEILNTAPNFIAIILVLYGVFLTGFTGGAIAGAGILFYAISKKSKGLNINIFDGIAGISGIAWTLWIIGFLTFFIVPQYWLLSLLLAAFGILIKVALKMGLIGIMNREEIKKE